MAKHDLINRQVSNGRDCVRKFCLWERQFKTYKPGIPLNWNCIKAKSSEKNQLPKAQGVYAFVVHPNPDEIVWGGYILYIGMTESQTFPARFQQYFNEPKRSKPRYWVAEMFSLWKDHLYYYYATTSSADAAKAEAVLLTALVPPNNERFPGTLAKIKKEIYGR